MPDGDGAYGNVVAKVLDDHEDFPSDPVPVVRTSENEEERPARRRTAWSPSTIVTAQE